MPGNVAFIADSNGVMAGSPVAGSTAADAAPGRTSVLIWIAILGVVLPALVLGGLRAGGFRFVFVK